MERPYSAFTITEKAERSLRAGHPWVYDAEVIDIRGSYENGDIVDVYTKRGKWLGAGYVNEHSKIRVRLISRNTNDRFDEAFYRRRIRYALQYRKQVMGEDFSACRLIFGEADQFPGLTVDLFGDVLVTETLCLGTERVKDVIFSALCDFLPDYGVTVRAVYERNEAKIRELEGMEPGKGYWQPERFEPVTDGGRVTITENGIRYEVDYINGQKTGFFLDQKYNRLAAAKLSKGRRVLDCFTHTGAFALNCAAAGAAHVTAVDISASAIEQTKVNTSLNGLTDRMDFVTADVFALLTDMVNEKRHDYDMIILDPPAFTKSSSTVRDAYRGYKDINYRAMRSLPRGGYLATCSCSHFMTDELFRKMLDEAAADAGVSLRQIEARAQAPDHPILRSVPETAYLKFYLLQIV